MKKYAEIECLRDSLRRVERARQSAERKCKRLEDKLNLTYSYTCRDGHEETETITTDEAIEQICEYRYRAEKAEHELSFLNKKNEDLILTDLLMEIDFVSRKRDLSNAERINRIRTICDILGVLGYEASRDE